MRTLSEFPCPQSAGNSSFGLEMAAKPKSTAWWIKSCGLAFAAAALVACGGGGGGGAPAVDPPPPTLSLQGPSTVIANTLYTYEAAVENGVASALEWDWGDG